MSEQSKFALNTAQVPLAVIKRLVEFHTRLKALADESDKANDGIASTLAELVDYFADDIMDNLETPIALLNPPIKMCLEARDNSGYVYLIQSPTSAYKIGRTINPKKRLKTFGNKLPFEVEYLAVIPTTDMYQLETDLHDLFADKRVNGEWFNLSIEDVEYIKGLAE